MRNSKSAIKTRREVVRWGRVQLLRLWLPMNGEVLSARPTRKGINVNINKTRRIRIVAGMAMVMAVGGQVDLQPVSAAPGTCTPSGIMCLSQGSSGSGSIYDFSIDDSNLSNNFYGDSPYFPVNDHTGSVRDKNIGTTMACVYVNSNYLGAVAGIAPYAGVMWVTSYSTNGSSIRFRTGATC